MCLLIVMQEIQAEQDRLLDEAGSESADAGTDGQASLKQRAAQATVLLVAQEVGGMPIVTP